MFSAWLVGWFVHGDGGGGDDRGLVIRFFDVQTSAAGRLGHGSACPRISVCKARVSSGRLALLSFSFSQPAADCFRVCCLAAAALLVD